MDLLLRIMAVTATRHKPSAICIYSSLSTRRWGKKNLILIYDVISTAFMEDILTTVYYARRLTYVSYIMESISYPV